MPNPINSLPTDPFLRHQKLNEIIHRHEEDFGIMAYMRASWRIFRNKATPADFEIFYFKSLEKERAINQARILGLNGKTGNTPKKMVAASDRFPDGPLPDKKDMIQRDIEEVGYTLLAQSVPDGSPDGYMRTWGLPENWGHPNLMITERHNLNLNAIVLDDLVEMVKAGKKLKHGEWINNILEGKLGFTVRLFREKIQQEEIFRVSYFDSKGKQSVKVSLPQPMLDALRQSNQNNKAS